MKFKLQVDGKEYEIAASAYGTVTVDGEVFETKTGSVGADKRNVQVGEKGYEIRVVESTEEVGCFILEVAGERVPLTVSDLVRDSSPIGAPSGAGPAAAAGTPAVPGAGSGAGQAAGQGGQTAGEAKDGLFAPVPGKIVDVFVKVGDSVEEGAPLVVLEAMKMENELRAPKKGTVTAVLVKKGDPADRGQLLVGIE